MSYVHTTYPSQTSQHCIFEFYASGEAGFWVRTGSECADYFAMCRLALQTRIFGCWARKLDCDFRTLLSRTADSPGLLLICHFVSLDPI